MPEKATEAGQDLAGPALQEMPLRRLLARLPIGVISVDRELRVDYANPAAHVFIDGIRLGTPLPDPLPEFSPQTFVRRLFSSRRPVRLLVETSGGRLLELDGIPGDEGESALLLVQEVTSREGRQRAEREFAANAAHELRTPIAAIMSALDVLRSGAKDVPEDRDLFLGHIERETARLGRLVEAFLLLARVQTGQEQLALRLVDVASLLDEVAAELEPQDDVRLSVQCELGLATLTDYDLLRQAIWNIASNAVGHTVSGEIRLVGRDLGRSTEIEVLDTGRGIAPADQSQLFDRFFRGRRRIGSGFGLGLPIAQEIARALGGTLDLDSEPGVGTRVRIQVPSARLVA
jgi:signal transduction histidine kinase